MSTIFRWAESGVRSELTFEVNPMGCGTLLKMRQMAVYKKKHIHIIQENNMHICQQELVWLASLYESVQYASNAVLSWGRINLLDRPFNRYVVTSYDFGDTE